MGDVSRDEMRKYVLAGFAARHHTPPPPPGGEAVVTIALGLLRQLDDPTGGAAVALASTVFGLLTLPAQVGQKVVDYYLSGKRDMPPFPQRPQIEPILRSWFTQAGASMPQAGEIDVLVNVEIGILQDKFPNGPKAAKQGVAEVLGNAYVAGVAP